jgi:hypothetical protein
MATRKKKLDSIEMPGTIGGAKIVFAEPTVVKGSHLTVTTYPDGRTELEWDDEALLSDVQNAIASVKTTQGEADGKTRKTRKSK